MKIKTLAAALALSVAAVLASPAHADELRLFATATFGDQESGFGSAEYGWGSGNSIFTLGASLLVVESEFKIGLNSGYTYLFRPEGNTGFVEGRLGSFDVSEFSDTAFYEASLGYRWYLSDRAAIGWNIVGYEQRKTGDDWDGNPFTRLQLIVSFD